MSAEAARIIKRITEKAPVGGSSLVLGTIKSMSPLTLQLDGVDFDISKGILVNASLLSHSRNGSVSGTPVSINNARISMDADLRAGDRVAVAQISNACNVIVCKVVSV